METLFPFTKFLPPELDERVAVDRAVERLRAAVAAHPLTVVSAPAGSGKTTALAAWALDIGEPVAWLRLSGDDDSPQITAAALLAAVRRVLPGFGDRLERVLGHSETAAGTLHLVTALVNDLGDSGTLFLVLDDFHEVTEHGTLSLFDALLDHLPPNVRLVVAGRGEPSLSLARRRVRGEVVELGLEELRLDADAVRAVLSHGGNAPEDVVEAVARASGGWAAAVRLAAARFGGRPGGDPATAARPELWRFLAEEVLEAQPEDLRAFLLQTAILDELTPAVCAAVTGRRDPSAVLADLERRDLFVVRYAGEGGVVWRYHDLFAEFLRDHLYAQLDADDIASLHRRAADVLPPARAVPHLLAAGDHERVAELAIEEAFADMDASILSVVTPWVDALPDEVVDRHPRLALLLAWRDEVTGRAAEIKARLGPLHARLQAGGDTVATAEIGLVLASAHIMVGELDPAGKLLDETLAEPLEGWARVAALALRMHWCRDRGDWPNASRSLGAAFDLAASADDGTVHRVLASALSPSLLFADQGPDWLLDRARWLAARLPDHSLSLTALRPVLAGGALLRLDLGLAADEVRRCLAESREVGGLAWAHQDGEALLLDLSLAAGDHATVRTVVKGALARMATSPLDAAMRYAYAAAALRSAWLRRDREELDAVADLLADPTRGEEGIVGAIAAGMQARLDGRADAALESLGEAEAAQRHLRCWLGAGLPGLERASILLEQDRPAAAVEAAEATLDAAARLGAGILLTAAAPHRPLLQRCAETGLHADVVRAVLGALDRPAGTAAVAVPGTNEALSPRELEVLAHVARGRSNRQIADALFISDVTVKSHLTRILRKLDATSRTHAVARARELHLL